MTGDLETARILGRIEGELVGINREIKDIKEILKCKSEDCENCKTEINERFEKDEARIEANTACRTGDAAVKTWWDSTLAKGGIIGGIILGIAGFIKGWF